MATAASPVLWSVMRSMIAPSFLPSSGESFRRFVYMLTLLRESSRRLAILRVSMEAAAPNQVLAGSASA